MNSIVSFAGDFVKGRALIGEHDDKFGISRFVNGCFYIGLGSTAVAVILANQARKEDSNKEGNQLNFKKISYGTGAVVAGAAGAVAFGTIMYMATLVTTALMKR